jgi:hypothetical protein
MATVLAALIGAAIGSLGSQVVAESFRRRAMREQSRRDTTDKYLLQLQDAIESVISRVVNLTSQHGRNAMDDRYLVTSTMYAFGVLLAQKRRLLLDGVYPKLQELEDGLGEQLEQALESIEREIGRETSSFPSFQRYSRLALAESVMERVGEHWTVGSYLAFAERIEGDSTVKETLGPARHFVDRLDKSDCGALLETLGAAGRLTARFTGIPLSVEAY